MQSPPQETPNAAKSDLGCRIIGEPFNPWHKLCGFYPPDIVGRQRDLNDGQKRLYERAVRWAGRNGTFWRSFDTIAEALGKSVRQVKNDMAILEARGLIKHSRRRRQSNKYFFLWHSMFEVQPTSHPILKVQDPNLDVQDKVILEVQSTARESSPIESCPRNLERADKKLITGDASQNPRSASSLGVSPAPRANAEHFPSSEPASEAGVNTAGWTRSELADVRQRITAFWGGVPAEGFEVSVMLRARGASAATVCELLDRKFANPKCRGGGRWAPRNQNWFLTVIENEFSPGHLPEHPAAPRREHHIELEELNRGIEVLELPTAGCSIVESLLCSDCGGYALVRYSDGTTEGCQCRQESGLARLGPASATGLGGLFGCGDQASGGSRKRATR